MATADSRPRLTPEQRQAVETTDVCVALSAGAGCGKTSVLTERFLSHLQPELGPDAAATSIAVRLSRITAITFTERAAREMRDRIRREVRRRLIAADTEATADHWLQLLRRLESAQISTIHSFCGTLLRRHAVEAGLDPRFAMLEPTAAETLVAELIDDTLRSGLAAGDSTLIELLADYGLGAVRDVVTYFLRERYRFRFADWISFTPESLVDLWSRFVRQELPAEIAKRLGSQGPVKRFLQMLRETPPPHETHATRFAQFADVVDSLSRTRKIAPLIDELRELATIKGGPRDAWAGFEDRKKDYQDTLEDVRKALKKVAELLAFDPEAALPAAEKALAFIRLAAPIAERYEAEKRAASQLDFDDLLLKTRDLLCGPGGANVRRRLSLSISRLLVDECQDTDPLQRELIEALVDGDQARAKLFLVGDFKQSIYRFRRADPQVFHDWRAQTTEAGRLPLSTNFRSQPAILDFVNALFDDAFDDARGNRYEPLRARRAQATQTPAIEFLWASPGTTSDANEADRPALTAETAANADSDDDKTEAKNVAALRAAEAEWIARRIRELIDAQAPIVAEFVDGGARARPVEFGDIAILFRALSDAAVYEAALERHGIPYYVVGGKAFYSQQEVYDLLNLLRTLDSNCDDVALVGVLRSPFFSLRDDTLFLLAQHPGGLADGLFATSLPEALTGDERRRAEFASTTLEELRAVKDRLPIAGLLNEILSRTAYDAVLAADFLGERKLANLYKLVEMARVFDQSQVGTLGEFIAWLTDTVAMQPNEAPAAVHAEKSPVVRLMSIHQSKGLEFPVVVVPDLQRRANDHKDTAAFEPRLGPIVRPPSGDDAVTGLNLFRYVERGLDEEESLRLFYVAVTRAADYLILSSGVASDQPPSGWREFLGERFDLQSGEPLRGRTDEPRVEIRVTAELPAAGTTERDRPPRPDWQKLLDAAARRRGRGDETSDRTTQPIAAAPVRRRFSFSRISGKLLVPQTEGERSERETLDDGGATGDAAGLGTLVHEVLATLDYAAPGDLRRAVERKRWRLGASGDAQADVAQVNEAVAILERFMKTPRARSIAAARRLYCELEFVLAWPLNAPPDDDSIYLQGFLDCLYVDAEGRWQLIDFKTNRRVDDAAAAAEPYRLQLSIYALAAERILGRAPDELVVCFLRTGAEHIFEWNDAARRRTLASLSKALPENRS